MNRWRRENRGFLAFLLCFGIFRTAVADWKPIPSSSMRPTLLEGDVVLVNRLAYDMKIALTDISLARLGEPQRGDVITLTSPKDGVRLIKRRDISGLFLATYSSAERIALWCQRISPAIGYRDLADSARPLSS